IDDRRLINSQVYVLDNFTQNPLRMPERDRNSQYTGGYNVPYTYPDLNNVYLAWADMVSQFDVNPPTNPDFWKWQQYQGQYVVKLPSYWRGKETGFGDLWVNNQGNITPNPNWTALAGNTAPLKYLTLRPRPADQLLPTEPQTAQYLQWLLANNQVFPLPASPTGDVRNLPGTGPNDSIWMDLGYPVVQLSTGRLVKPIFSILVMDLDGRVNLNLAGNLTEVTNTIPPTRTHGSNQGWGPWEVNPRQLMGNSAGGNQLEYPALFWGNGSAYGRYGLTG